MTESIKATRALVQIGSLEVDGFMLPDGSYRMSQTQAAECIELAERNTREILDSKTFKRLMGEGYTPAILETDLTRLGEGFALDDVLRQERDYFEQLLRENGIDPWGLPRAENHDE